MSKRIIDFDPLTGMTTWFDYDPQTDITYVGREADVESILEVNKTLANMPEYSKGGMKAGMWHYATIPNILIEKWMVEDGIDAYKRDHWPAVVRKINSPDYRWLKTTAKRHEVRN